MKKAKEKQVGSKDSKYQKCSLRMTEIFIKLPVELQNKVILNFEPIEIYRLVENGFNLKNVCCLIKDEEDEEDETNKFENIVIKEYNNKKAFMAFVQSISRYPVILIKSQSFIVKLSVFEQLSLKNHTIIFIIDGSLPIDIFGSYLTNKVSNKPCLFVLNQKEIIALFFSDALIGDNSYSLSTNTLSINSIFDITSKKNQFYLPSVEYLQFSYNFDACEDNSHNLEVSSKPTFFFSEVFHSAVVSSFNSFETFNFIGRYFGLIDVYNKNSKSNNISEYKEIQQCSTIWNINDIISFTNLPQSMRLYIKPHTFTLIPNPKTSFLMNITTLHINICITYPSSKRYNIPILSNIEFPFLESLKISLHYKEFENDFGDGSSFCRFRIGNIIAKKLDSFILMVPEISYLSALFFGTIVTGDSLRLLAISVEMTEYCDVDYSLGEDYQGILIQSPALVKLMLLASNLKLYRCNLNDFQFPSKEDIVFKNTTDLFVGPDFKITTEYDSLYCRTLLHINYERYSFPKLKNFELMIPAFDEDIEDTDIFITRFTGFRNSDCLIRASFSLIPQDPDQQKVDQNAFINIQHFRLIEFKPRKNPNTKSWSTSLQYLSVVDGFVDNLKNLDLRSLKELDISDKALKMTNSWYYIFLKEQMAKQNYKYRRIPN